jgi:hypothetical protein
MSDDGGMDRRLDRIEKRLTLIEEGVAAIRTAQKDTAVVRALKDHVNDMRKAMDAITDMAAQIKGSVR